MLRAFLCLFYFLNKHNIYSHFNSFQVTKQQIKICINFAHFIVSIVAANSNIFSKFKKKKNKLKLYKIVSQLKNFVFQI